MVRFQSQTNNRKPNNRNKSMGCFHVSCGVSRISMGGGEKCVLIPLVTVDPKEAEHYDGAFVVSNDGPKAVYVPFALPIYGTYNDYGTMEEIEEDSNTAAIEKFFGCKIEKFVDRCCRQFDNEKCGNDKMPKAPLGMFVQREVFEWMANTQLTEYNDKAECNAFEDYEMNSHTLRIIGFVEGEKAKRERYDRPFTHPEIPGLVLWSDGTWLEVELKGKKTPAWIYHPTNLVKFLEEKKLPVPAAIYALKSRTNTDVEYDKELAAIRKSEKMCRDTYESLKKAGLDDKEATRLSASMADMMGRNHLFRFGGSWYRADDLLPMYGHLFDTPEFKNLLVKFKTFEHNLWFVNAPYQPSWCGLQCGSDTSTQKLAKLTYDIMERRLAEYRKMAEEEAREEAEEAEKAKKKKAKKK